MEYFKKPTDDNEVLNEVELVQNYSSSWAILCSTGLATIFRTDIPGKDRLMGGLRWTLMYVIKKTSLDRFLIENYFGSLSSFMFLVPSARGTSTAILHF